MAEAPKAPPPAVPPPAPAAATAAPPTTGKVFSVVSGVRKRPQRIVIYGPGGIGKSSLAAMAPEPIFADIEAGTDGMDVRRLGEIETWSDLRESLRSPVMNGSETVVIDTVTKAEEMAVAHTLLTVKNEKGKAVSSIEGYGFGKGTQHVYDTFLLLLADLDGQIRAGRNVILIVHSCTADVPNPAGEDFIRYEPRLQGPKSGKASIRNRVFEWADYVFFIGYDVATEDGKGLGAGTRTIYTAEMPTHIAKARALPQLPPLPATLEFQNVTDNK